MGIIIIAILTIIIIPIWGWILALGGVLIYSGWNIIEHKGR